MTSPICRRLAVLIAAIALASCAAPPRPQAGTGSARETVDAGAVRLDVFTYRPDGCVPKALLIVFHGVGRNADDYRDYARPLADRFCLTVAAPRFDKERFPAPRYQFGGLADGGRPADRREWTGWTVLDLVDRLRQREGRPDLPYYLIGHSAGGQFLGRFAAVIPNRAERIVIANPSTWVLPALDSDPPYGFRGMPSAEERLRQYLAQPITVLLGQEDHGSKHLARTAEAMAQGDTRFERGERAFRQAKAAAAAHGWPFNWHLVEVPGVGHDARAMFAAPMAAEALGIGGTP